MIKVDIISGFLGAGKTTLVSKLIKEKLNNEKIVLIENEFGEIGIDGGFLKEAGVIINEMNSGCICCSLVGDFEEALKEVIKTYSPNRIIIEPSGVGKLSDVIKAINKIEGIEINSYSTVVDTNKAKIYSKNFQEFFNDQVESAACVILSKTQNSNFDKLKETLEIVKNLNMSARVITTNWDELTADEILKAMEGSVDLFKADDHECCCNHHHDEHHHDHECGCNHHHEEHHHDHECECNHHAKHDHHHAEDYFTSIGFETINQYSIEQINDILSNLNEEVIRAKGIVLSPQGKWLFFDYVPEEIDIREGSPAYTGLITVIGTKALDVDKVKALFGIN